LIVGAADADPNGSYSGRSYMVLVGGGDNIFKNGFEQAPLPSHRNFSDVALGI